MTNGKLVGFKIVVVDDELTFQALMTMALSDEGAHVEAADDAQGGLDAVLRTRPDLLISDISLPEQDGFWLRRQVKERAPDSNLASISLTGFSGPEAEQASIEAGFDLTLVKPVDLDRLIEVVATLVRARSGQIAGASIKAQ